MSEYKKLYVPFAVMVLLLAGLVVWLVVKNHNAVPDEDGQSVTFLDISSENIVSLSVASGSGDVVTVNHIADNVGLMIWQLEGYGTEETDSDKIADYVRMLSTFVSTKVIDSPSSLSDYGLDTPDYTVTIVDDSGNTSVIRLGNNTYDNMFCYAKLEGSDTVYTITSMKKDYCAYTYLNFLSGTVVHIDYSELSNVVFERASDDVTINADCSLGTNGSPEFTVNDPYNIRSSSYFEQLITSISDLEVISYIDISDEDLALYGLDEPCYRFVFTFKYDEPVTVELSAEQSGVLYGRSSNCEHEFLISATAIQNLNVGLRDLLSYYVCYYASYEVSSITCNYGDRSFRMELDTPGAIDDEEAIISIDGRNCNVHTSDGRSFAAILFESVACIEIGGFELDAAPEYTDPVMTLSIVTKRYETIPVAFVERSDDSYYVFIDNEYTGYFVYEDQLFADGGTDTYSYGIWPAYDLLNNAIINSVNGIYDIPSSDESTEGAA